MENTAEARGRAGPVAACRRPVARIGIRPPRKTGIWGPLTKTFCRVLEGHLRTLLFFFFKNRKVAAERLLAELY